jgi:hypothetical protein
MKTVCAWLLIGALMASPAVAETSPHDQAALLKPGTRIEVLSSNGDKFKGRMGEVSNDTLTLLDTDSSTAARRVLRWADVTRLKNKDHPVRKTVIVTTITVFGVLFGLGLALHATGCC